MRLGLVPRRENFFGLFTEMGANTHAIAQLVEQRFREFPDSTGIKSREDDGDRVVRSAVAALFEDDDISPRLIIRWKDIFETLEDALDACDTAGHLISNIVVKNA